MFDCFDRGGDSSIDTFTHSCYLQGEEGVAVEEAEQLVAGGYGAYAGRGAGEEQVARGEGDELGEVRKQLPDGKYHVAAVALLDGLPVAEEGEVEVVYGVPQLAQGDELPEGGTAVEAFGEQPGHAFFFGFALQVARGEVDAKGDVVVIEVRIVGGASVTGACDADYQLYLVLHVVGEGGVGQWLAVGEEGGVGFEKEVGLGGGGCLHFLGMWGIVADNTEYFHGWVLLGGTVTDDVDTAVAGGFEAVD